MSSFDSCPAIGPTTQPTPLKDFRRLWRRTTRNVFLGTLISVLPAFVFYWVAFSHTPHPVGVLLRIIPVLLLALLAVDLALNWWYLGPLRRLGGTDGTSQELARVYARLHNLRLFSFGRVFGPHALTASILAQLAVLDANARWNLGIPKEDFWGYWLLNLTLVPIGQAIFEYLRTDATEPLRK